MARIIGLFALIGAIVAAALGSAASLGTIGGADIAASNEVVGSCDTGGVSVEYITQTQNHPAPLHFEVAGVKVTDLSAECAGQYVLVSLQDATGGQIAFGLSGQDCNTSAGSAVSSGQISGGEATAELCTYVPVEDVAGISILVKSTPQ